MCDDRNRRDSCDSCFPRGVSHRKESNDMRKTTVVGWERGFDHRFSLVLLGPIAMIDLSDVRLKAQIGNADDPSTTTRAAISNNGRKKFSREQPCSPEQRELTGLPSPIRVQAIQIRTAGQCATSPVAPWSPDYVTHRFKYFIRKLELPDRYSLH